MASLLLYVRWRSFSSLDQPPLSFHSPTDTYVHVYKDFRFSKHSIFGYKTNFSVACERGKKLNCLAPVAVYASMVIDNTMKIMYHVRNVICYVSLSRVHTRLLYCNDYNSLQLSKLQHFVILQINNEMNGYSYVNSLTLTLVGNTTYTRELYVIKIEFIVPVGNNIAMTVKQLDRIIHCEKL